MPIANRLMDFAILILAILIATHGVFTASVPETLFGMFLAYTDNMLYERSRECAAEVERTRRAATLSGLDGEVL